MPDRFLYLATPSTPAIRDAMTAGLIGCMTTPAQGNRIPDGASYACDNGKFGKGWPGPDKWFAWLERTVTRHGADRCLWAVAPDVPFDAAGTLAESTPWLARIRSLGIPAAYAAQDGCENGLMPPWDAFDVLFIAGTTEWKLSRVAAELADEARAHGLKVHMGRVNSEDRLRRAIAVGCDTADGTFLAFGPDTNLPRLMAWFTRMPKRQPPHVEFPMFDLPTAEGAA
jgi:hypothetical protein